MLGSPSILRDSSEILNHFQECYPEHVDRYHSSNDSTSDEPSWIRPNQTQKASKIARDRFLLHVERMSEALDASRSKGSSPGVNSGLRRKTAAKTNANKIKKRRADSLNGISSSRYVLEEDREPFFW